MIVFEGIIGAFGVLAAVWTIAFTIPTMGWKRHQSALWVLAVGIGINSIATLMAEPGTDLDTGLTILGDALIVGGAWLIIFARWRNH